MNSRTRIFLNPTDNILVGKFQGTSEHIHICLDSSVLPFSVQMPDLLFHENREFIFYNMPENGIGNIVTIKSVSGQQINVNTFSHALNPFDTVTFVSDMRKRWLLSDINA